MNILMTGSTGFTGRQVSAVLENSGHVVYHLVRIPHGLINETVWDSTSTIPESIPRCEVIIALAAHAYFGPDMDRKQYDTNTVAVMYLASFARRCGAYFILASMAGIHGYLHSLIDSKTPVIPQNHYGMSKYLAEEMLRSSVEDWSVLRIAGIYGINGPAHLGLNKAITEAILQGIAPTLAGPGSGKRNYICVADVVSWIKHLVEAFGGTGVVTDNFRRPLYLAGPETFSIRQYLEMVVSVLLPGSTITELAGKDAVDSIVTPTSFPFPPTLFQEYLQWVKTEYRKADRS